MTFTTHKIPVFFQLHFHYSSRMLAIDLRTWASSLSISAFRFSTIFCKSLLALKRISLTQTFSLTQRSCCFSRRWRVRRTASRYCIAACLRRRVRSSADSRGIFIVSSNSLSGERWGCWLKLGLCCTALMIGLT